MLEALSHFKSDQLPGSWRDGFCVGHGESAGWAELLCSNLLNILSQAPCKSV